MWADSEFLNNSIFVYFETPIPNSSLQSFSEEAVIEAFAQKFGPVIRADLQVDRLGNFKGCGIIFFVNSGKGERAATRALQLEEQERKVNVCGVCVKYKPRYENKSQKMKKRNYFWTVHEVKVKPTKVEKSEQDKEQQKKKKKEKRKEKMREKKKEKKLLKADVNKNKEQIEFNKTIHQSTNLINQQSSSLQIMNNVQERDSLQFTSHMNNLNSSQNLNQLKQQQQQYIIQNINEQQQIASSISSSQQTSSSYQFNQVSPSYSFQSNDINQIHPQIHQLPSHSSEYYNRQIQPIQTFSINLNQTNNQQQYLLPFSPQQQQDLTNQYNQTQSFQQNQLIQPPLYSNYLNNLNQTQIPLQNNHQYIEPITLPQNIQQKQLTSQLNINSSYVDQQQIDQNSPEKVKKQLRLSAPVFQPKRNQNINILVKSDTVTPFHQQILPQQQQIQQNYSFNQNIQQNQLQISQQQLIFQDDGQQNNFDLLSNLNQNTNEQIIQVNDKIIQNDNYLVSQIKFDERKDQKILNDNIEQQLDSNYNSIEKSQETKESQQLNQINQNQIEFEQQTDSIHEEQKAVVESETSQYNQQQNKDAKQKDQSDSESQQDHNPGIVIFPPLQLSSLPFPPSFASTQNQESQARKMMNQQMIQLHQNVQLQQQIHFLKQLQTHQQEIQERNEQINETNQNINNQQSIKINTQQQDLSFEELDQNEGNEQQNSSSQSSQFDISSSKLVKFGNLNNFSQFPNQIIPPSLPFFFPFPYPNAYQYYLPFENPMIFSQSKLDGEQQQFILDEIETKLEKEKEKEKEQEIQQKPEKINQISMEKETQNENYQNEIIQKDVMSDVNIYNQNEGIKLKKESCEEILNEKNISCNNINDVEEYNDENENRQSGEDVDEYLDVKHNQTNLSYVDEIEKKEIMKQLKTTKNNDELKDHQIQSALKRKKIDKQVNNPMNNNIQTNIAQQRTQQPKVSYQIKPKQTQRKQFITQPHPSQPSNIKRSKNSIKQLINQQSSQIQKQSHSPVLQSSSSLQISSSQPPMQTSSQSFSQFSSNSQPIKSANRNRSPLQSIQQRNYSLQHQYPFPFTFMIPSTQDYQQRQDNLRLEQDEDKNQAQRSNSLSKKQNSSSLHSKIIHQQQFKGGFPDHQQSPISFLSNVKQITSPTPKNISILNSSSTSSHPSQDLQSELQSDIMPLEIHSPFIQENQQDVSNVHNQSHIICNSNTPSKLNQLQVEQNKFFLDKDEIEIENKNMNDENNEIRIKDKTKIKVNKQDKFEQEQQFDMKKKSNSMKNIIIDCQTDHNKSDKDICLQFQKLEEKEKQEIDTNSNIDMTEMKRTYSEQKQDFKIENKEIKISVESIQSEIPSELQLNSKPVEDPLSLQISINNEDVDNELLRDAADEVEGEEGLDGTISNNRNQTNGQSDDEEDDVCEDANAQQVQEQAKAERRMRDWVTYMNQVYLNYYASMNFVQQDKSSFNSQNSGISNLIPPSSLNISQIQQQSLNLIQPIPIPYIYPYFQTQSSQQQNIPLNPIVSNPSLYYTALAQQQRMISSQTGSGISNNQMNNLFPLHFPQQPIPYNQSGQYEDGDEELKEKEDKSDLVSVRSHISTHTQRTSTMPSLSSVAETQDAEDQDDKQIFEKERLLTKDEVPKEKELNLNIQKLKDKEKDSIKEDLSDKLSIYSHISTTTTRTAGMWSVASAKTAHTLQTTISKDSGGSGGSHLVPQNVLPYPGYGYIFANSPFYPDLLVKQGELNTDDEQKYIEMIEKQNENNEDEQCYNQKCQEKEDHIDQMPTVLQKSPVSNKTKQQTSHFTIKPSQSSSQIPSTMQFLNPASFLPQNQQSNNYPGKKSSLAKEKSEQTISNQQQQQQQLFGLQSLNNQFQIPGMFPVIQNPQMNVNGLYFYPPSFNNGTIMQPQYNQLQQQFSSNIIQQPHFQTQQIKNRETNTFRDYSAWEEQNTTLNQNSSDHINKSFPQNNESLSKSKQDQNIFQQQNFQRNNMKPAQQKQQKTNLEQQDSNNQKINFNKKQIKQQQINKIQDNLQNNSSDQENGSEYSSFVSLSPSLDSSDHSRTLSNISDSISSYSISSNSNISRSSKSTYQSHKSNSHNSNKHIRIKYKQDTHKNVQSEKQMKSPAQQTLSSLSSYDSNTSISSFISSKSSQTHHSHHHHNNNSKKKHTSINSHIIHQQNTQELISKDQTPISIINNQNVILYDQSPAIDLPPPSPSYNGNINERQTKHNQTSTNHIGNIQQDHNKHIRIKHKNSVYQPDDEYAGTELTLNFYKAGIEKRKGINQYSHQQLEIQRSNEGGITRTTSEPNILISQFLQKNQADNKQNTIQLNNQLNINNQLNKNKQLSSQGKKNKSNQQHSSTNILSIPQSIQISPSNVVMNSSNQIFSPVSNHSDKSYDSTIQSPFSLISSSSSFFQTPGQASPSVHSESSIESFHFGTNQFLQYNDTETQNKNFNLSFHPIYANSSQLNLSPSSQSTTSLLPQANQSNHSCTSPESQVPTQNLNREIASVQVINERNYTKNL